MEIEKFLLREFNINTEFERQGGEAFVSKARHPRLGKVAIKRWKIDAHNSDNEIKLLTQNCNHPNIVQFVGILLNSDSNAIGYIMPYMAFGSLHDVIHDKSQNYDEKQMSSWITQICYGLSHLHFKNITHRDIKPNNVLLGKSYDDVKLADFGIARSIENISHSLTKGVGTILYMAPEILEGKNYTTSADSYSLSITIWEILHRRCWDENIDERPTIDEVLELLDNTEFVYLDHKDTIEENTNFSNDSDDDTLSKTIIVNNIELENSQNRLDALHAIASNDDEQPPIPPRVTSGRPPFPKLIEKNPNKETILLIGGRSRNKIVDSLVILQNNGENDGNWKQLNIKLPYAVYHHGAQFFNNCLYIFGGRNEKKEVLNSSYKLTRGLRWDKIKDMNEKRKNISNSSVILNDRIWVISGKNGEERLKSVEMYDPQTNTWTNMKEMSECRSLAAAAVVHEKIFCCGGHNAKKLLKSAECYDSSSDVWTLISDMPGPNATCGIVVMDAHLIVIGGAADIGKDFLSSVWVLDTTDKNAKWIEKEPRLSRPLCQFSIAKIDDTIFVCGGTYIGQEDSNCYRTSKVKIFDGKVWRNGPTMVTGRDLAPAAVIPVEFARNLEQFIPESSGCSVQ